MPTLFARPRRTVRHGRIVLAGHVNDRLVAVDDTDRIAQKALPQKRVRRLARAAGSCKQVALALEREQSPMHQHAIERRQGLGDLPIHRKRLQVGVRPCALVALGVDILRINAHVDIARGAFRHLVA